jgi:hypothetical protein
MHLESKGPETLLFAQEYREIVNDLPTSTRRLRRRRRHPLAALLLLSSIDFPVRPDEPAKERNPLELHRHRPESLPDREEGYKALVPSPEERME